VEDAQTPQPAEEAPKKKRKARNTFNAYEITEQVDFAAMMIAHGKAPWQIRLEMTEKWGLDRRTCDRRIEGARTQVAREYCGYERQEKVAELIAAMQTTLDMSVKNGRGSDAIGAVRLISELLSLSPKH
jgi:hypothetical protein